MVLTQAGKEELALALLLWKDFKSGSRCDVEITKQAIHLATTFGVYKEFDRALTIYPPMRIEPRMTWSSNITEKRASVATAPGFRS